MAFLSRLNTIKGANKVEVYGMPQWMNFENIETDYYKSLDVHLPAPFYIERRMPEVQVFQHKFYEAYSYVPDEDAYNGYDVTLFVGKMLLRHGLNFPGKLARENFEGLHGEFRFSKIYPDDYIPDSSNKFDYWENTFLHMLHFEKTGFAPVKP